MCFSQWQASYSEPYEREHPARIQPSGLWLRQYRLPSDPQRQFYITTYEQLAATSSDIEVSCHICTVNVSVLPLHGFSLFILSTEMLT